MEFEMYKKIILVFCMVFIFTSNLVFEAQGIFYDEFGTVADTSELCANQEYTLLNNNDNSYQYIYVLDDNHQIQEVIINNQSEPKITFPVNFDVGFIATIDIENGIENPESLSVQEIKVSDCQNKIIQEEYKGTKIQAKVNFKNEQLYFSMPEIEKATNYKLEYQKVNGHKAKTYDFDQEAKIKVEENNIYQISETYQLNDKKYEKKYEIKFINNNFYIKEVKDFETKNIKFNQYFKKKQVIILIILILIFILLSNKQRAYRKKQKRYLKRKKKLEANKKKRRKMSYWE